MGFPTFEEGPPTLPAPVTGVSRPTDDFAPEDFEFRISQRHEIGLRVPVGATGVTILWSDSAGRSSVVSWWNLEIDETLSGVPQRN